MAAAPRKRATKARTEKAIKPSEAMAELGSSGGGENRFGLGFSNDDFIPALRGERALKKYREMRDNDAVIGAVLTAMEMMLRAVEWRVEPVDDTPAAKEAAEFVESVFEDMSHTFTDFVGEVLSFLPFGFSFFEVVYKRRMGPEQKDAAKRSKFSDGRIGVRKLAPRDQMSLERFEFDEGGGIVAFIQSVVGRTSIRIPIDKGLLFRTVSSNNSPHGRSVLRNAYKSYYYLTNIQNIEAIAIERELNGLPVGRVPSSYLKSNANADQRAFKSKFEQMLRDVKVNEQGFILLPSDMWPNPDGTPSSQRMVEFELLASKGTRAIDTSKTITRYQQDEARTVLADFVMLGTGDRGSFALSKSKADLFLRALEAYLNNIAETLNRHLIPKLWSLNGMSYDLMPAFIPGNVAPVDLGELGDYISKLAMAGAPLFPDEELSNTLRTSANLPEQADDDPDLLGRPGQEDAE